MINNKDGSMVLSKAELAELTEAYRDLYRIFNAMMIDYTDQPEYLNVKKWHCFLEGRDFKLSDYIDE